MIILTSPQQFNILYYTYHRTSLIVLVYILQQTEQNNTDQNVG